MTGDLFDLTGRTAVVTGAARGLGLAASTVLAAHGAKVVLLDLLSTQVEEAAGKLRATGRPRSQYRGT